MKLLNIGNNAKTIKSDESGNGWLTAILYLAPAKTSGFQVCPSSSQGCRDSCLFTAGRGKMNMVQEARNRKTRLFFKDRKLFLDQLHTDITKHREKSLDQKLKPCVRLNGTSDLAWERLDKSLFTRFADVQFYDYTKIKRRMDKYVSGDLPKNYHLTFSRTENNWRSCKSILDRGGNVAIVFIDVPPSYKGLKVYNGDETDLRFLDPRGLIGLKAKGKAKHDRTGFTIKKN